MRFNQASFIVAGVLLALAFLCCRTNALERGNNCCEKKLFDFKSKQDLEKWGVKQGAKVSICKKDGRTCARIFFPKHTGPKTRWPAFYVIGDKKIAQNWPCYDKLVFEVLLETEIIPNSPFPVLLRGQGKEKYFEKPTIPRGKWTTVSINIDKDWLHWRNFNSALILELNIYQSHTHFDKVIYIDNIKLKSSIPDKLKDLAVEYDKIGAKKKSARIRLLLNQLRDGKIQLKEAAAAYEKYNSSFREELKKLLAKKFSEIFPDGRFTVAQVDCMDKVLPSVMGFNAAIVPVFKLEMAKNEFEAIQALIIASGNEGLKQLSVKVLPFKLEGAPGVTFKPENIKAAPVGFVKTRKGTKFARYCGYYPDPILEFLDAVDVKKGEAQSFWIRFKTDADTKPGVYKGAFVFRGKNAGQVKIPAEIKVWNFTVPKTGHLKFATSVYGSKLMPKSRKGRFYDYILDNYRISPFSIYNDQERYRPTIADYVRRKPMGLNFIPIIYLKLPRQTLFTKCTSTESKIKWSKMSSAAQKHYPEAWKKKYLEYLGKKIPELKKAGLWDISYCYAFDEADPSEWPACAELCRTLKAKYPGLKIVSTVFDQSYGTKSVFGKTLNGWIASFRRYNYELAEKVRKQGKQVWWYTTTMTIDRDKLPDIRAFLGSRSFANRVDGFLVWTVNRWNNNKIPITSGPYTQWNPESFPNANGGGSYFCGGPNGSFLPTIRAEAIRDGLEDYEYFYLLEKLSAGLDAKDPLRKQAENLLASLKKENGIQSGELRELRRNTASLIEKIKKRTYSRDK